MIKSFWLFILLGISQLITAQYTDIINSNRPSFSTSPFSIGTYVYQVETGFYYRKSQIKKRFSNPKSIGYKLNLRYSHFDEKLEFDLDLDYRFDRIAFRNLFTSYKNINGLSGFTVGAKYLIYTQEYEDKSKEVRDWKKRTAFDKNRLIPSVGVYFGINTPLVNGYYGPKLSPKLAVFLQNDITNRYIILTNFIADKLGTTQASYTYIITETYALNDKYSIFLENLGRYNVNYGNEMHFAAGAAYLKSNNLQLDASLRILIEGKSLGAFLGFGVSWRLDNHSAHVKITADKRSKERIIANKNRDKSTNAKKKNALQHIYIKSKKLRKPKSIKKTKRIKSKKRRIKKIPRTNRVKKSKKKGVLKGLFKKRRKKSDDN